MGGEGSVLCVGVAEDVLGCTLGPAAADDVVGSAKPDDVGGKWGFLDWQCDGQGVRWGIV